MQGALSTDVTEKEAISDGPSNTSSFISFIASFWKSKREESQPVKEKEVVSDSPSDFNSPDSFLKGGWQDTDGIELTEDTGSKKAEEARLKADEEAKRVAAEEKKAAEAKKAAEEKKAAEAKRKEEGERVWHPGLEEIIKVENHKYDIDDFKKYLNGLKDRNIDTIKINCHLISEGFTNKWLKEMWDLELSITDLNLYFCDNITNDGLGCLGSTLKSLDLGYCYNVTDAGIDIITRQCPNLERLDLSGCTNVTNDSLNSLKSLSNLRQLNLSGTLASMTGDQALQSWKEKVQDFKQTEVESQKPSPEVQSFQDQNKAKYNKMIEDKKSKGSCTNTKSYL